MLYALLDGSAVIEAEHLRVALAVWDYCEASARHLFGEGCNNTDRHAGQAEESLAVRLLNTITAQPGINRRGLYESLGGNIKKEKMVEALAYLHAHDLAHPREISTTGRPGECWFPGPAAESERANDLPAEPELTLCSIARNEPGEAPAAVADMAAPQPSGKDEERSGGVGEAEARPVPEERPGRWVVKVGEIPPRADGSLIPPMGLPELVEAVRGLGGRFAWMDGAVLVVAPQPIPRAVAAALAEHQDDLRLLVPQPVPDLASVPERDDPFIRRMLAIGTEGERERERRETLEPLRRAFAKDGIEFPPAP